MSVRDKRNKLLWCLAFCAAAFLQCGNELAGNSTQIGNGMIAGVVYERDGKTPAQAAHVFLRRKTTLGTLPAALMKSCADTAATAMTDNGGAFAIDFVDTGLYILEATDGINDFAINDSVAVKDPDSTIFLPPDTLKPAGAIKGAIRLSEGGNPQKVFVLAWGIDRFAIVESDGSFRFRSLAQGRYDVRILSTIDNYEVVDLSDIPVKSADTTDLGVIDLPFTGIPTIRNISIAYDTLKQWVTVRWNRPHNPPVKSFNVYRRELDPAQANMTQLNFFPVLDTFFVDSLCEPKRTFEYHVASVDMDGNEGARSPGAIARIALFDIVPKNVTMLYDTVRQTVTLRWSNPDTTLVTSYNVYRRSINRNEIFWTPFNRSPIVDTFFIDSLFNLSQTSRLECDDSSNLKEPSYEYCVAAVIKNVREGARSAGMPVAICLAYLTPKSVDFSYDTLKQTVYLRWSRPDMTLVRSFSVFRRAVDKNDTVFSRISSVNAGDSTGEQNQYYEYRIGAVLKDVRAEVMSAGVIGANCRVFHRRYGFP